MIRHPAGPKQITAERHQRHCIDDDPTKIDDDPTNPHGPGAPRVWPTETDSPVRFSTCNRFGLAFRRVRQGASWCLASSIPFRTIDDGVSIMSLNTDLSKSRLRSVLAAMLAQEGAARFLFAHWLFLSTGLLIHQSSLAQVFAWSLSGKGPTPPGHNLLDSATICIIIIIIILSSSFL
jgi:hypothetical protein